MPVVIFTLPDTDAVRESREVICTEACRVFAEILAAPVERIRAYIQILPAAQIAAGGGWLGLPDATLLAPFYQFFVLQDRAASQVQELHAAFTAILVTSLGIDRMEIRGICTRVSPADWAIGGIAADRARKQELEARAGQE